MAKIIARVDELNSEPEVCRSWPRSQNLIGLFLFHGPKVARPLKVGRPPGDHEEIGLHHEPSRSSCLPSERSKLMSLPVLYLKPGCPWCSEVVDYLAQKDIAVKSVVVSGNPEAMQEMINLSGQSKAPTLDWHGEVLADFGVEELVPFLREKGVV